MSTAQISLECNRIVRKDVQIDTVCVLVDLPIIRLIEGMEVLRTHVCDANVNKQQRSPRGTAGSSKIETCGQLSEYCLLK